MSHKIRFLLIAGLVLFAMFLLPRMSMAAPSHASVSAHGSVHQVSLRHKPYHKNKDLSYDSGLLNSGFMPPFMWHRLRHRHIIIFVRIDCRFFSCNIHSFNGNSIEIEKGFAPPPPPVGTVAGGTDTSAPAASGTDMSVPVVSGLNP